MRFSPTFLSFSFILTGLDVRAAPYPFSATTHHRAVANANVRAHFDPFTQRNMPPRRATEAELAANRGRTLVRPFERVPRDLPEHDEVGEAAQVYALYVGPPTRTQPPHRRKRHLSCTPHVVLSSASSTASSQSNTTEESTSSSLPTASPPGSTTSSGVTTSSTSPSSPKVGNFVAAYYPDWTTMAPESIDWTRFDWIDYAFAIPDSDFTLSLPDNPSGDLLSRLASSAHGAGKKVKLSVGGWTGSTYFSSAVSSSANRQTFANNILSFYKQYSLDGIDIDWEYPGMQGAGGNEVSPNDAANFLSFLKVLRATLPNGAVITAATQVWPWTGSNGLPISDVSQYAKYLDWILVMNYDVWGSSSQPGANAPLSDGCGNSSQPLANAVAAVKTWTDAGFPASQITLGVPSYGYISQSSATHLTDRRRRIVTVTNDDGGTSDGQIQFNELVSQGALQKKSGKYVGANGFQRMWDDCSSTPFLRSAQADQVVTYDDPESLFLKGRFAQEAGILGVNMFDVHGDTASWELVDALRSGLGII